MEFKAELTGARIKELRDNQKMKQADYFGVSLDYLLTGRSNEVVKVKLRIAIDLLEQIEKSV